MSETRCDATPARGRTPRSPSSRRSSPAAGGASTASAPRRRPPPAHPTDASALATDPPRPDMFAPDMFAPAESNLSEAQWMILAAEAEPVTLAAVAGFRDAWRNTPRETRSVSALAAARAAIDAACASAPEKATTAPEKATTAPEKATTRARVHRRPRRGARRPRDSMRVSILRRLRQVRARGLRRLHAPNRQRRSRDTNR